MYISNEDDYNALKDIVLNKNIFETKALALKISVAFLKNHLQM
jgi:hypothetical protein